MRVKACGICGSDLHFATHGAEMLALSDAMEGTPDLGGPPVDLGADVFMGHEFSAEVLELGPDTSGPGEGTLVTSIPILVDGSGLRPIVYSERRGGRLRRADAPLGPAAWSRSPTVSTPATPRLPSPWRSACTP